MGGKAATLQIKKFFIVDSLQSRTVRSLHFIVMHFKRRNRLNFRSAAEQQVVFFQTAIGSAASRLHGDVSKKMTVCAVLHRAARNHFGTSVFALMYMIHGKILLFRVLPEK